MANKFSEKDFWGKSEEKRTSTTQNTSTAQKTTKASGFDADKFWESPAPSATQKNAAATTPATASALKSRIQDNSYDQFISRVMGQRAPSAAGQNSFTTSAYANADSTDNQKAEGKAADPRLVQAQNFADRQFDDLKRLTDLYQAGEIDYKTLQNAGKRYDVALAGLSKTQSKVKKEEKVLQQEKEDRLAQASWALQNGEISTEEYRKAYAEANGEEYVPLPKFTSAPIAGGKLSKSVIQEGQLTSQVKQTSATDKLRTQGGNGPAVNSSDFERQYYIDLAEKRKNEFQQNDYSQMLEAAEKELEAAEWDMSVASWSISTGDYNPDLYRDAESRAEAARANVEQLKAKQKQQGMYSILQGNEDLTGKSFEEIVQIGKLKFDQKQESNANYKSVTGKIGVLLDRSAAGMPTTTYAAKGAKRAMELADNEWRMPTSDWNEDQENLYYYLLAVDQDLANEYAADTNDAKNMVRNQAEVQAAQDYGTEHPFASVVGSEVNQLSLAGLADTADAWAEKAIRGRLTVKPELTTNQYYNTATAQVAQNLNDQYGTIDDDVFIFGGKGWGDVMQLGLSVLNSSLMAHLGGAFGGGGEFYTDLAFFGSAASEGIENAKRKGASDEKALLYGTIQGINEALFEHLSIENLINMKDPKYISDWVKNWLTQSGIEASEEVCTSVANLVADQFINGDMSEYNELYNQFYNSASNIKNTAEREEYARKEAIKKISGDLAFDAIGGFASGGMSAGAKMIPGAISKSVRDSRIANNMRENNAVGDLVNYAQKYNVDSETIDAVKDNTKDGVLNRLHNNADISALYDETIQKMLEAPVEQKNSQESTGGDDTHKSAVSDTGETMVNLEDGSTRAVNLGPISEIRDGSVLFQADGENISSENISFRNSGEAAMVDVIRDMGENVKPAMANKLLQWQRDSGDTRGEFATAVQEAFNAAKLGVPVSKAEQFRGAYGDKLNSVQRAAIFDIGSKVYQAEYSRAQEIQPALAAAQKQAAALQAEPTAVVNGVKYDGITADQQLNDQQKASLQFIEGLAAAGLDVHVFMSQEGDPVQGNYSRMDGSLSFDLAYGDDRQGVVAYGVSHELTHFAEQQAPEAFQLFSQKLFEALDMDVESAIRDKADVLRARADYANATEDAILADARSEVIAEACETMLTNTDAAQKLKQKLEQENPSLVKKIAQFFRDIAKRLREAFAGLNPDSEIAASAMDTISQVEELADLWSSAVAEGVQNFRAAAEAVLTENAEAVSTDEIVTNGVFVTDGEGSLHSIRSMKADIADGQMFEDLKELGYSQEQVDELKQNLNALVDYMTPFRDILDMNEDYGREKRKFSPYKPNSDPLYKISMDFSTLCSKRILTQHVIEQLQLRENRPMTAEEQMAIRSMLNQYRKQEKGLQVACAMCYVEAARLKSPKVMLQFMDDPGKYMRDYFADANKEFASRIAQKQANFKVRRGYAPDATKKQMKASDVTELNKIRPSMRQEYQPSAAEQAIIDKAVSLPRSTYLTAANLANLHESDPEIYAAYTARVRTATRAKALETDEPYYYGDSARDNGNGIVVTDAFIQAVNRENGMRFSSWSDWRIEHMLDYITAVIDNSVRGAAMHGYTKFPAEVRVLGKTGMMFNLSGVAGSQNGLNEDGSLNFSPTESINFEEAMKVRDEFPETAGMQCIGVSDAHIQALLDSKDIDYIIPYHTSGLNKDLRRMADIHGWKDYTKTQHAANDTSIQQKDAADPEHWHEEPVWSEFFVGYDTGMSGIEAMQESAERYKQMCRDRGLKPKFEDFSNDQNYWKLLIDRKMINQKTGNLIQQKPVKPNFDFKEITRIVDQFLEDYKTNKGMEDRALQHITEHWKEIPAAIKDLKAKKKTAKTGSLKAMETVANEVLAAQQKGSLHATRNMTAEQREQSERFAAEVQEWYDEGMPANKRKDEYFILGTTSESFQALGAMENDIYMLASKIRAILGGDKPKSAHPEITINEIKQIPEILSDPILMLKSRSVDGRILAFGDPVGKNGRPILSVLDLRPFEGNLQIENMQKISSTYTKTESQDNSLEDVVREFLKKSDVLYVDEKRTIPLLRRLGIEKPSGLLRYGYTGSVTYDEGSVKAEGVPFDEITPLKATRNAANVKNMDDELRAWDEEADAMEKSHAYDMKQLQTEMQRQWDEEAAAMEASHKYDVEQMTAEYKQKLKETREKLQKDARDHLDDVTKQYRDSRKAAVENRNRTEIRHKILGMDKKFHQMATAPRKADSLHAPIPLMNALAKFCEIFQDSEARAVEYARQNLEYREAAVLSEMEYKGVTKTRMNEAAAIERQRERLAKRMEAITQLKKAYTDIQNDSVYAMYHDEFVQKHLDALTEKLADTDIYDMDTTQLQEVYDTMKAMEHTIVNANKVISAGKDKTLIGMTNKLREQIGAVKVLHNPLMNTIRRYWQWQMSPDTFFNYLCGYVKGNEGRVVQKMFSNGTERMLGVHRDFYQMFRDLTESDDANVRKAIQKMMGKPMDDMVDWGLKNANGKSVKTSRGMMLQAYLLLKQEDSFRSLLMGGFKIPDAKQYYTGHADAAYSDNDSGELLSAAIGESYQDLVHQINEANEPVKELERKAADLRKQLSTKGLSQAEKNGIHYRLDQIQQQIREASKPVEELRQRAQNLEQSAAMQLIEIRDNLEQTIRNDPVMSQLVDHAAQWYKHSGELLSEVFEQMYGYRPALVDGYTPIHRDLTNVKTDIREDTSNPFNLENAGLTKERVQSIAPIKLTDFFTELSNHTQQISRYYGFAQAQKDLNRIWNLKMPGSRVTINTMVADKYGAGAARFGVSGEDYVNNYIKSIAGGAKNQDILSAFYGNAASATLSLNPRVALSQAASVPTAASVVGWGSMARGFAKGLSTSLSSAKKAQLANDSVWFWQRYRGAGGSTEFSDLKMKGTLWQRASSTAVGKALFNWCQAMDVFSTASMWAMAEDAVQHQQNLKPGADGYQAAVEQMYADIIRKSQPNYTVTERSDLLRDQRGGMKLLTMYKTQSNQNLNILMNSIGEFRAMSADYQAKRNGVTKADLQQAKRKMANGITSVSIGGTLGFVLIRTLVNFAMGKVKSYRDDETDEVTLESTMEAMAKEAMSSIAGMFALGGQMFDFIWTAVSGEKYYGISDSAISNITAVAENLNKVVQEATDSDKELKAKDVEKAVMSIMTVVGVPANNAKTMALAAKQWADDLQNGTLGQYTSDDTTKKQYRARILKAWEAGDLDKVNNSLAILQASSSKDTDEAVAKDVSHGFANEYLKDMVLDGSVAPDDAVKLLKHIGHDDPDGIVQKWEFAKDHPESDMSDRGISWWYQNKDVPTDIAEAAFAFANNAQADKDKNGKTISGSKKEKIVNYVSGLKLTNDQKKRLFLGLNAGALKGTPWE